MRPDFDDARVLALCPFQPCGELAWTMASVGEEGGDRDRCERDSARKARLSDVGPDDEGRPLSLSENLQLWLSLIAFTVLDALFIWWLFL